MNAWEKYIYKMQKERSEAYDPYLDTIEKELILSEKLAHGYQRQ